MAGLLKQLIDAFRTVTPQRSLPTDGWCELSGIARMNVVWPWYAVDDSAELVDSYGRGVGVTPLVELHAPRTDSDAVLIAWSEPGSDLAVGTDWAMSLARLYHGRLEANSPISLAGLTGHLARVSHSQEMTWRVIVPRRSATVQISVTVPARHADAYWLQIESMLATWGWDS